ncbi:MAG: carbon-nitrogen family hydrolase [Halobacteriaceae archaeon]
MKLALAQIEIIPKDVEGNIERAESAIQSAANNNADCIALPEIFSVGFFAFDAYEDIAEPIGGKTHSRLRTAANEYDIAVLAGSIVEDLSATQQQTDIDVPPSNGLANTSVFFDHNGTRRGIYRKHHLFGYESREAELLEPGTELNVVQYGGFTIGITTCYDLRFPELYRKLLDRNTSLILVPSAWPYPRVEHWLTLPQTRAIENLEYVATVNGVGDFENATLAGRSRIFDPWGITKASTGDTADIIYADLDPERVKSIRDDFPALEDRRY